jgi:peptide/nickel transport system permease protein
VIVYITKRVLMTIVVVIVVVVFLSLLIHIVPGDPAKTILGVRATPEAIARVRDAMGLDKPVLVQVGSFFWNALHGSFGIDIFTGKPIGEFISRALPHTIALAFSSLVLAILLGIPLGVYSATHLDTWLDRITAVISISFVVIPYFVTGLLLLLLFAVKLRLLPAIGVGQEGHVWDYIRHLTLPSVALALTWIGYLARLIRTSLLEILGENYIRAAKGAGLKQRLIVYKYALKNALIPTVAVLGNGLGSLLGGAVIAEVIFTRPGMGSLIFEAIQTRNYPIVRACVLVVATFFVVANLLADLSYVYLDPRIRLDEERI